jgi:ubiquinone/menaquinone biosynthesis C-methylase UbiE
MLGKKYTAIETWIWDSLSPVESDSAHQLFDNMLLQGGGKLPVINVGQNLREPAHFADEAMIQQFAAVVGDVRDVLDVGPGDGWPALRIAPFVKQVVGIDLSNRRVEVCKANAERLRINNARFMHMPATELDLAENSFDAVVASSSIEQTPNPLQALEQVYRVLRPGGRFMVKFESLDVTLTGALAEAVVLRDHFDSSHGWYYSLKHRDPPWERDYLVRFQHTPEMAEAFGKAREMIAQAGDNPTAVREIGVDFLETNKASVESCSYYELEHFTAQTMVETLEEIGFAEVRSLYSAGKLANLLVPHLNMADLPEQQLNDLPRALAQLALKLPAPLDQGQPVVATKPETPRN